MLLDYSKLSHDELVSQLRSYLESKDSWKGLTDLSTTSNIIQVTSAIGELLIYLLERRAEELYLGTARLDNSIMLLAQGLNYNPRRKTSATTTIEFIFKDEASQLETEVPVGGSFDIPAYTRIQSSSNPDIVFVTAEAVSFEEGDSRKSVQAYQGRIINKTFISTGYPLQRYYIEEENIENDFLFVTVNNVQWTVQLSLAGSEESDEVVVVRTLPGYVGVSLLFGDNINGKIPPANTTIQMTGLISDGKLGNINTLDDINIILDEGSIPVPTGYFITATNTAAAAGGADEETMTSIKENANKVFVVSERSMISKTNWIYQMKRYPGIRQLNVYGEYDIASITPDPNLANIVYLRILGELDESGQPTKVRNNDGSLTQLGQNILAYAEKYKSITVRVDLEDAQVVDLIMSVEGIITRDKNSSIIRNKVDSVISGNINYDTITVGQPLYLSEAYKVIQTNVPELSYSFVKFEAFDLGGIQDINEPNSYQFNTSLKNIKRLSFKLFLNELLIATDNGQGVLVAETFTPVINPTAPSIQINPTPGAIDDGDYKYKVVFISENIGHTEPSPESNEVTISLTPTAWNNSTAYVVGNIVSHNSSNYICTLDNTNVEPGEVGSEPYWGVFYPSSGLRVSVTVPVSESDRVTRRDIYRQKNAGLWFYVGSLYDNETVLFEDNVDNGALVEELDITTNNTDKYFDDTGANIDYVTGIGNPLKFNAIIDGTPFYYRYEQDLNGNITPELNQILNIKTKDISINYQD